MPFALNESTKYISPTKTPEYLAGGKPVISTSISDVVNDYSMLNMVKIADTAEEFVKAGELLLREKNNSDWLEQVDIHLADNSWDNTWSQMSEIMTTMLNIKSVKSKVN
jgi:UDP-galactopyranose mutase